jgi:hypothetical protein
MPVTLRRRIGELFASEPRDSFDAAAYAAACRRAADRSGLLACGHAPTAVAATPGERTHVVKFAASPKYRIARRTLRTRR